MSTSSPVTSPQPSAEKKSSPSASKEKDRDKQDGRVSTGAEVAIEDLSMPKSMVQRLAKSALPPGTQIQKDAVTALSKSSTVFINQLAAGAQVHTSASGKKTIQPHDVMAGLRDNEFDFMIPHLEAELARWKEKEANKRNEYKKKAQSKAEEKQSAGEEMTAERQLAEESGISIGATEEMTIREIDRERSAKRARGSGGLPVAMGGADEDEEDIGGLDATVEEDVEDEDVGDVGDDVEDDEDGDETQEEEVEGRVGTEDEGREGDETEEQDDSD